MWYFQTGNGFIHTCIAECRQDFQVNQWQTLLKLQLFTNTFFSDHQEVQSNKSIQILGCMQEWGQKFIADNFHYPKLSLVISVAWSSYMLSHSLNSLERFSFECQRVIGFALSTSHDWLKRFAPFFIQSEVQPKPIVTRSHALSRALR